VLGARRLSQREHGDGEITSFRSSRAGPPRPNLQKQRRAPGQFKEASGKKSRGRVAVVSYAPLPVALRVSKSSGSRVARGGGYPEARRHEFANTWCNTAKDSGCGQGILIAKVGGSLSLPPSLPPTLLLLLHLSILSPTHPLTHSHSLSLSLSLSLGISIRKKPLLPVHR
jgi:hypothetical protein